MSNTSVLRTGVSDYLKNKKSKQYEFAEKPNYVNPFKSDSKKSIADENQSSPKKRHSIERRHTENYNAQSSTDFNDSLHLTPCRWDTTGWKYSNQGSVYFDHQNKRKNMLGYSGNKLYSIQHSPIRQKTNYQSSFKAKDYQALNHNLKNSLSFNAQKGIPNQANYISECYPSLPMGDKSSSVYQRQANDFFNRNRNSLNIGSGTKVRTPDKVRAPRSLNR